MTKRTERTPAEVSETCAKLHNAGFKEGFRGDYKSDAAMMSDYSEHYLRGYNEGQAALHEEATGS